MTPFLLATLTLVALAWGVRRHRAERARRKAGRRPPLTWFVG